jgi:hypothetical protein
MSAILEVRPDDEATAAVTGLTRVVVPTDPRDERLARVREAALQLATRHGWEVVLYDRSHERWTDTPHPTGPVGADELDPEEWAHLVRQLRDIERAGVTATAWLATVPALTAMIDALQELAVDGVLLPSQLGQPKVMDRLLEGSDPASMVERVADLHLDDPPTFLVLDDDGGLSVEPDPDRLR